MFALLILFDGIIVGMLVFYLIAYFFGDKPLVRLMKLLLGIASGVAYSMLCVELNYGEMGADVSMATVCIIFFGPVALMAIIWVINYMFKK